MSCVGWAGSPFQFKVATASLGRSVVSFLAAFGNFDCRLYVRSCGRIHLSNSDRAMLALFYIDIVIPLLGPLLRWLQHNGGRIVA